MDVKSLERSGKVAALRRGGEILLIGPWDVFLGVAPRLLIQDASRLRAVLYPYLRDDSALAKLTTMARQIICMGSVAGHYSPQQALEQMVGLLQAGQISAMTVPDTSGSDENTNIQRAALTGIRAGPASQWPLAERFGYVLERSPYYMSDALGAELRRTFNERTLALVVGTLVVWAGSHAIGIGFVADAALLAIGFSLAGWAIFDGIQYLMRFFNLAMNASSVGELDQAAEQFAKGVMAMGVGAVISLLTRGAGRLARRPAGHSTPRPAEPTQTRKPAAGAGQQPSRLSTAELNRQAVKNYGIPDTLSAHQARHIPPVADGRSVLTADPADLLRGLHEGQYPILRQPKPGQVMVDFGRPIGEFWNLSGTPTRVGPTNFGSVLYGKKGAHIVPANPVQW